ncbi:MAG: DMT family transporter [Rhizobiaceae bacterium]
MDTSGRPQNIARGITLIVAAALTISVQDAVFKLFSGQLTLWQIFALRGCLAIPMLLVVGRAAGKNATGVGTLRLALGRWPLLRSAFITTTFLCFYAAIPFLSLSTVGAANYIAPIFVTLLSAYVISEPVGKRGWIGVFLGFTGVVVLLQPGSDAFSPWALLPVIGAGFYALAHITTRAKCQDVSMAALALSQNTIMCLAGFLVSGLLLTLKPDGEVARAFPYIFGTWASVSLADVAVLTLLAAFAVVIGMLLAGAYQAAPPPTVATFEYSYLVFVALWDILFFAVMPTLPSLTGMVLIVGAGLLVMRR